MKVPVEYEINSSGRVEVGSKLVVEERTLFVDRLLLSAHAKRERW
jgi:hypothetical protein